MKLLFLILFLICFTSCIPLRIAPNIKTDKVMVAKKFKRKLPKRFAFIFEDTKDANEFYNYVNTKYELNYVDVEWNVPFIIDGNQFFFSFHEIEIPNKTLNLLSFLIDAKLESDGWSPLFEDSYVSRKGNWYIAITVANDSMVDCLKPNSIDRDKILKYLRVLRVEFLNTHNYLETLLSKK